MHTFFNGLKYYLLSVGTTGSTCAYKVFEVLEVHVTFCDLFRVLRRALLSLCVFLSGPVPVRRRRRRRAQPRRRGQGKEIQPPPPRRNNRSSVLTARMSTSRIPFIARRARTVFAYACVRGVIGRLAGAAVAGVCSHAGGAEADRRAPQGEEGRVRRPTARSTCTAQPETHRATQATCNPQLEARKHTKA